MSSSIFIGFSRSLDENTSIPTQPGKELRGLNSYIVSESLSRRPFYSKFPVTVLHLRHLTNMLRNSIIKRWNTY